MRSQILHGAVAVQLAILSASALSLQSFQQAPQGISIVCGLAYAKTINDCQTLDFTGGRTCSAECLSGLVQTSFTLSLLCSGSQGISSASLLGQVLIGNIIPALCPTRTSTTTTAIATFPPPSMFVPKASVTSVISTTTPEVILTATSPEPVPTTQPAQTTTLAPTVAQTTVMTTTSSLEATTELSRTTSRTISSTTASFVATPTGNILPSVTFLTSTVNSAGQTQTNVVPQMKPSDYASLTAQQGQIIANANSGGGSPFDIVLSSDAASKGAGTVLTVAIAWSCVMLVS